MLRNSESTHLGCFWKTTLAKMGRGVKEVELSISQMYVPLTPTLSRQGRGSNLRTQETASSGLLPSHLSVEDGHFHPDVLYLIDWDLGWVAIQDD